MPRTSVGKRGDLDGDGDLEEPLPIDLDGNARVQYCRVDVGVYETPHPPAVFDDCSENAAEDDCDIYDGTSEDCNQNHLPDECIWLEDDCQPDGTPDECDIADGTSLDRNNNGFPDECECVPAELAKLLASDGAASDTLARSVAISGDAALIGASGDDDSGDSSASAYIFRFEDATWLQEAKLLASNGADGDRFGHSVAIHGAVAGIGAPYDDDHGSAYVVRFDGSNWSEEAKLLAADGAANDRFGESVAISESTIVVGARYDDDNGTDSGSAYIFRYDGSTWMQEAKLLASDGAPDDRFGHSLSTTGSTAIIGAPFDDEADTDFGSAYAFHGLSDCQPNGVLDICDLASGDSEDNNGNGIPDECEECAGDVDGDGDTDLTDLAALLSAYGSVPGDPNWNPACDFDGDNDVDLTDLAFVLSDYGCGG